MLLCKEIQSDETKRILQWTLWKIWEINMPNSDKDSWSHVRPPVFKVKHLFTTSLTRESYSDKLFQCTYALRQTWTNLNLYPFHAVAKLLGESRHVGDWISDLQAWHIQALGLERFSWCAHSVSFPPSRCLSSAGLTQQGLSPTRTTQLELPEQWHQRQKSPCQWRTTTIATGQTTGEGGEGPPGGSSDMPGKRSGAGATRQRTQITPVSR